MRKLLFALPLAACTVADDKAGSVYAFNGDTVTIRGARDQTLSTAEPKPTPVMVQQAKDICPGAKLIGSNPHSDGWTSLFLFRC